MKFEATESSSAFKRRTASESSERKFNYASTRKVKAIDTIAAAQIVLAKQRLFELPQYEPMPNNQHADSQSRSIVEVMAECQSLKRELGRREQARSRELDFAQRVQRSMLPRPVHHHNIDIDVRYVPLEMIGGDYCQVLFPVDSCCYVTLCDVAGHGIGPALLTTRVSSEVRRLVLAQLSPSDIVKHLNRFVVDHFADTESFLTFFVARFDFERGIVVYSGAGHPGPLLIRAGSNQVKVLHSQNFVIGIVEDCLDEHSSDQLEVRPGDRMIFFTDGLTETINAEGRMLGVEGVVRMATITCVGGLFEVADCFLERLDSFRNGFPQDDLTLIVAEVK